MPKGSFTITKVVLKKKKKIIFTFFYMHVIKFQKNLMNRLCKNFFLYFCIFRPKNPHLPKPQAKYEFSLKILSHFYPLLMPVTRKSLNDKLKI